jgi:3-phenylpropionate/trans-cinnamate dioxygenase ferredoxin reductase subunit
MNHQQIVVVGGSVAGGRAAETLRRNGYEGRIVLVGEEPHRPYDRPPLSKKFLRGEVNQDSLHLRPMAHYERLRLELELGARAVKLDPVARAVEFVDGRKLHFDRLLIATGARVRRLSCPGATLEGVHYVRSLEDAIGLREEMQPGRRVVVVGAGVIGAEVAASCRESGLEVVMIESASQPLMRAFGSEVGRIYGDVHRARGVDLRCGESVARLEGQSRVRAVVTTGGAHIECDFVVVGIGVEPAVQWLEGSGIELDGGIIVNERCETTIAGIYAAGDVTRFWDPRLGKRTCVESIDNAQNQGVAAAQNALGKDTVYAPIPFFWSDQFDLKLQSVGYVGAFDEVVYRGSVEGRAFVAFHLREDRLAFAIGVNRLQELAAAKKIIAAGMTVSREALRDESVSLGELAPKPR